jgi:hypothetical protein
MVATTATLSLDILQYILSYLNKECYQDRNNMTNIRFIPGIYENMFGYLYQNVTDQYIDGLFGCIAQFLHITRPNVVCYSYYRFSSIDSICSITYFFNDARPSDERDPKKTHTIENCTYIFK